MLSRVSFGCLLPWFSLVGLFESTDKAVARFPTLVHCQATTLSTNTKPRLAVVEDSTFPLVFQFIAVFPPAAVTGAETLTRDPKMSFAAVLSWSRMFYFGVF